MSNSFLYLLQFLAGKHKLSLNKDYADNLIISDLFIPSIQETLINEISRIPSNIITNINVDKKKIYFYKINYKENTIPFESIQGLEIIDKWADKWGYIIRSLKKQTDNISFDLSGGFDTRALLALFLNSNIDINHIFIRSINNNRSTHEQDYKIAKNISSKLGFRLNNYKYGLNGLDIKWGFKNSLFCEFYTRLGFHKGLSWNNYFYQKPRFSFTGGGGENIRGCPCMDIKNYVNKLSKNSFKIKGYEKEFSDSLLRMLNRSIDFIKKKNTSKNEYELAYTLHTEFLCKNHYGKAALKSFLRNWYSFEPLMDPDLKLLKYDIEDEFPHDLLAYIYIRFAPDLISFPFEGNRILNNKSIIKATKLNNELNPYKIMNDYNENFYIDLKRKLPVKEPNNVKNEEKYLKNLFKSKDFFTKINKIYDKNVLEWANEYEKISKHFPLRQNFALLAIAKVLEYL